MKLAGITREILGSAIQVHSTLGPGLLEHAYRACLSHEIRRRGLAVVEECPLPITYDGIKRIVTDSVTSVHSVVHFFGSSGK
jgi:GxxExxY protein